MRIEDINYDVTQDAIFLPGKIHGAVDDVYVIYYNPDSMMMYYEDAPDNAKVGCWEIEVINKDTIKKAYKYAVGGGDFDFDFIDYIYNNCDSRGTYYIPDDEDDYSNYYEDADWIFDRDGGSEVEFFKKFAGIDNH